MYICSARKSDRERERTNELINCVDGWVGGHASCLEEATLIVCIVLVIVRFSHSDS